MSISNMPANLSSSNRTSGGGCTYTYQECFRHGSEKSGLALGEFLRDLYTLFKKAPARKDDYFNAAGESTPKLPLKFCGHRWLENVPAAERALEIWPFVLLYSKAVRKRGKRAILQELSNHRGKGVRSAFHSQAALVHFSSQHFKAFS
ncbi:hypothetical protein PoB_005917700 [Plakobranchus ocellatus]|uniref:Uncharacterized protein n=1 Tax=Plakobranchus ocellatus TaxID=259542 RepID=A0AAV4CM52_9GAST|nr:hypothetical protein PoB_005917700 [Plakobranchus ocellatus]